MNSEKPPLTRIELVAAYETGDMGDVEFFELALGLGLELAEIEHCLQMQREI